jgi:hypothetical protein
MLEIINQIGRKFEVNYNLWWTVGVRGPSRELVRGFVFLNFPAKIIKKYEVFVREIKVNGKLSG